MAKSISETKAALPAPPALDAIDRRILRLLQRDNRIANQDLAQAVGLSPPACLKRVRRLRDSGVIRADAALVDPAAVGYPILVLARVALDRPREDLLQAFERKVREIPEVLQCWCVAGDTDFEMLICAKSLEDYQAFARRTLAGEPNIRTYTSNIVLSVTKSTVELPIGG